MFGFINKLIKKEVEQQLRHKLHEHSKRYPLVSPHFGNVEIAFDNVIDILWEVRTKNKPIIEQLQVDLAAIHAHYRSELCNDCCHSEVCKLRPNVKYGFDCEDKGYELEVMAFEVEPEKVEGEKEETNADHI